MVMAAIVMATGANKSPYDLHVPSDKKATFIVLDIGKKVTW